VIWNWPIIAWERDRRGAPLRSWHARPFSRSPDRRLLVMYHPVRIAMSQVYPFALYSKQIEAHHGVQVRLAPVGLLDGGLPPWLRSADTVGFQTWLTEPPERLPRALERIRALFGGPRLIYFDSFANLDARSAAVLNPEISIYARKSLPEDPSVLARPTLGDTQLTDYYNRLYGIDAPTSRFEVPDGFVEKMRLTPNFHAAPRFLHHLVQNGPDGLVEERPIALHARMGLGREGGWYGTMRRDAAARVRAMDDLELRAEGSVDFDTFLAELRASQLCFSPFGYGELCWRDIEAVIAGAVLVKPDMSHLRVAPDLFVAGETYVPVRWDFADLEDVVRGLLADPKRCRRIARRAYEVLHRDVVEGRMLETLSFAFGPAPSAAKAGRDVSMA
jgi:hypothetical protein